MTKPRENKSGIRYRSDAQALAALHAPPEDDAPGEDDSDGIDHATALDAKASEKASAGLLRRLRRHHKNYDPLASLAVAVLPSRHQTRE